MSIPLSKIPIEDIIVSIEMGVKSFLKCSVYNFSKIIQLEAILMKMENILSS